MPYVKVTDIAYVRLHSPSLDEAEEFLAHFGMARAERTKDALYMRGSDPNHHLHVTHLGKPKFGGLAFFVENEDELKKAAKAPGATGVENLDEPGRGKRVRVMDPDGFQVEIICGMKQLAPLPVSFNVLNTGENKLHRAGKVTRMERGAALVKRIGHGVIMSTEPARATRWYRETLGLVPSDDVYAGPKENVIATFNRCDRGETYVDHHVFLSLAGPKSGLNHVSYEVQSVDDLLKGHEHLKSKNYKHVWGVGRHVLGSQIYDYWQDPWGRVHEHWTDSDVLNVHNAPNLVPVEIGLASQWGESPPQEFITHASA
jgi:catechol 2,3-dioxygenase-like lactoylglutathione lyase family enzyme